MHGCCRHTCRGTGANLIPLPASQVQLSSDFSNLIVVGRTVSAVGSFENANLADVVQGRVFCSASDG